MSVPLGPELGVAVESGPRAEQPDESGQEVRARPWGPDAIDAGHGRTGKDAEPTVTIPNRAMHTVMPAKDGPGRRWPTAAVTASSTVSRDVKAASCSVRMIANSRIPTPRPIRVSSST